MQIRRGLAVASLLPLLAGIAACSDGDKEAGDKAKGAACDGLLKPADSAAKLPAGFPALDGQVLYEPSTQGKTTIVYGRLGQSDFLGARDALVAKLKAAGYEIEGTDQESVEAEAEFKGAQEGTVKVQPLCQGNISLRYKFNG